MFLKLPLLNFCIPIVGQVKIYQNLELKILVVESHRLIFQLVDPVTEFPIRVKGFLAVQHAINNGIISECFKIPFFKAYNRNTVFFMKELTFS